MNTEWLVRLGRAVFFPIQALLHVLARFAYVAASALAVLMALALALRLLPEVGALVVAIKELDLALDEVLYGSILLLDLGLVAYLVDKCKGKMRTSLRQLWDHFRQSLGRPWLPPMVVQEGLLLTWREVRSLPMAVNDGFRPSLVVFISAIIANLAALFGQLAVGVPEAEHQHVELGDRLEALQTKVEVGAEERAGIKSEVEETKEVIAVLSGRVDSLDTLVRERSHDGANEASAFYLMFENPKLEDGTGICLDETNQRWVLGLKQAIGEACDEVSRDVAVKVTGFSSIAPVLVNGSDDMSGELNCEIANLRAGAVVEMLRQDDPEQASLACRDRVEAFQRKQKFCDGRGGPSSHSSGRGLSIVYNSWSDPEASELSRPVNDGTAKVRYRGAEAMNRVVQVVVRDGGCLFRGGISG